MTIGMCLPLKLDGPSYFSKAEGEPENWRTETDIQTCRYCGEITDSWQAREDHRVDGSFTARCKESSGRSGQEYIIFHPSYPGWIWAEVNEDGETDNKILAHIISKMREGIYTKKGLNLRCVPNIQRKIGKLAKKGDPQKRQVLALVAKAKDCTTLGELFAPKKAKGSQIGLRTISEKDRYKGKIDWESNRHQITDWLSDGWSLWKIAKQLNISPSTLSEANKRFGLYDPRKSVHDQIRDSG